MRTVSGMVLAVAVGLAAGCGGGSNPAPTGTTDVPLTQNPPAKKDDPPAKTDPPKKDDTPPKPKDTPPAPEVGWEMDPAKHKVPDAPARGKLAGGDFAPEAQFQSDTLTFRVLNKEGLPVQQLTVKFGPAQAKAIAGDGLKLTVKPDQLAGPDIPLVMTEAPGPKPEEPKVAAYVNGYALTLELGKREKGKLPGKVYLSLPGDEKSYLAGTFTAEWLRPPSEPPGPDDAPFVQGSVAVTGVKDPQVKVGYAAQPTPEEFALDAAQMPVLGPGRWTRSDYAKPRVTTLVGADAPDKPARYEHVRLAPGRYLVYAVVPDGGPAAWKWVTVAPDTKQTVDLTIDAAKVGRLEVKVPAGFTGKVQLAPAEEEGKAVPPALFIGISLSLGLEADPKDGVARFQKLGPGKYEVKAGDLTGTAEVKPGETATVELMPKKK